MALSAGPNITGPTLEYSTYAPLQYYHKLQQLIIYSIAVCKQPIRPLEAGKSQGKYPKLTS